MMVDGYLVSIDEACEALGVEVQDLYRLVDEGSVPAYLIDDQLRFRSSDLCESAS